MRGTKAKMIRRKVKQLINPEDIGESTQYQTINHPSKQRINPNTGTYTPYYPIQYVVKSAFRRMVLDVKREYKLVMRSTALPTFS